MFNVSILNNLLSEICMKQSFLAEMCNWEIWYFWLQQDALLAVFDYVTTGENTGSATRDWLPGEIEWGTVP